MNCRKWSSCVSSTRSLTAGWFGTGVPIPCCRRCRFASVYLYCDRPGMYSRIEAKLAVPVITDRICRRVSQLLAFLYVSAIASRYIRWDGCNIPSTPSSSFTAFDAWRADQRYPAFSGDTTFKTATRISAVCWAYLLFVLSVHLFHSICGWLIVLTPPSSRKALRSRSGLLPPPRTTSPSREEAVLVLSEEAKT